MYAVTTELLDDDVKDILFLSLVIYRYLEKDLGQDFTCEMILDKLKNMNFANIQDQGFIPLYTRDRLTDSLHKICGFDTDFKFITKSQMKTIQKKREIIKYYSLKRRLKSLQRLYFLALQRFYFLKLSKTGLYCFRENSVIVRIYPKQKIIHLTANYDSVIFNSS